MSIILGCLMIGASCKGWMDNITKPPARYPRPIKEHTPVYSRG